MEAAIMLIMQSKLKRVKTLMTSVYVRFVVTF